MKSLKAFKISISTVVLRFYLMMTLVVVAGFSGYWLVGLLALPVFLSIMMGVSFSWKSKFEKPTPAENYILKPTTKENLSKVA